MDNTRGVVGWAFLCMAGLFPGVTVFAASPPGRIDYTVPVGANGLADAIETAPDSGSPDYDNSGSGPDAVADTDGDGTADYRDLDSDADGIPDIEEAGKDALDGDHDGDVDDATDLDGDGIPNVLDGSPTWKDPPAPNLPNPTLGASDTGQSPGSEATQIVLYLVGFAPHAL